MFRIFRLPLEMTLRMARKPNALRTYSSDGGPISDDRHPELVLVGWQERIDLPELGISQLTVKLDTGAVSSSIHAQNIRVFRRNQNDWVRFDLCDSLGIPREEARCESRLLGFRRIRSSSGHLAQRPVIETMLVLAGFYWTIELTLAHRPTMHFPVLLGRDALAGRCMVDCGQIFLSHQRHIKVHRDH